MTRRRVRVAVVLLALLAVVGTFTMMMVPQGPRPGDGITPESVAAIRPGMTHTEVEALLGCPSGNYAPRGTGFRTISIGWSGGHTESWSSRYAGAYVIFDVSGAGGKVASVIPKTVDDSPTSPNDRLRTAWLRLWPW